MQELVDLYQLMLRADARKLQLLKPFPANLEEEVGVDHKKLGVFDP